MCLKFHSDFCACLFVFQQFVFNTYATSWYRGKLTGTIGKSVGESHFPSIKILQVSRNSHLRIMISWCFYMLVVLSVVYAVHSLECPASCPLISDLYGKGPGCCSVGDGAPGCGICDPAACAAYGFHSCEDVYGSKCDFQSPGCVVDVLDTNVGLHRIGVLVGSACKWEGSVVLCSENSGDCKPIDSDHICARNAFIDDKPSADDSETPGGGGPCGGTADQDDAYIFDTDDDMTQQEFGALYQDDADEDVYGAEEDDRTSRVVFVGFATSTAHDDMDGDDENVDDVYPSTDTDSVFDGGDDATRPDDDIDPVPVGSDDRFESPLFVTAHTEDVDLDAATTNTAGTEASSGVSKPCGNLRGSGGATGPSAAHPVEDFFVLRATNAFQSFLWGTSRDAQ